MLDMAGLARELAALRDGTTKPCNLNFFCHAPPQADAAREARWHAALAPYFSEFGIDPATIARGPGRAPFSAEAASLLEQFRPAVVSFHFGLPPDALLARVRAIGARVLASATTVAEARALERRGVDAIIAQGLEAGGHRGMFETDDLTTQSGTLALLPQIVRAVGVPVIAAGGIADAHGVRAALALGATAVQAGTVYLLCPEATTSAVHREALASARSTRPSPTCSPVVRRVASSIASFAKSVRSAPTRRLSRSPLQRLRRCAPLPSGLARAIFRRCGPDRMRAAAAPCRQRT
jgi:nitronate monooxygenase